MPGLKNKKKILVITVLLLLAFAMVLGAIYIYTYKQNNKIGSTDTTESTPDIENKINFEPPTDTEQQSGDNKKQQIVKNQEVEKPNTANVVIVDASQYEKEVEVRAFASNTVKKGSCEITFEQNGISFTKTVAAFADASSSPCAALVVPVTEFKKPGTWNVTVKYTNDSITGSSSKNMEIKL